jgi:hypothetical protein
MLMRYVFHVMYTVLFLYFEPFWRKCNRVRFQLHVNLIDRNQNHTRLATFDVRFQVLTATSMKMTVFWDVVPCSVVEIDCRFRGAYCLLHQGD